MPNAELGIEDVAGIKKQLCLSPPRLQIRKGKYFKLERENILLFNNK